jgi:hypothetical protein
LIELQRSAAFKNDVPRVIRPDILLTEMVSASRSWIRFRAASA